MIFEISLVLLALISLLVVRLKDLLYAVIVMGASDSLIAFIFFLLEAPDIAITQVAVAAGLSTMIFIVAIAKTKRMEE